MPLKKKLIIIGARGWGREVFHAVKHNPLLYLRIKVKGFLDSDSHALDNLKGCFPPILSSVEDYSIKPGDIFFCALGDPVQREKYSRIIENKGGKFISIISPRASVNPSATIGKGSFIDDYVLISDNVSIGKNCIVQRMSTIGHDVSIGDYVTLGADVFCGGNAKIESFCTVNVKSLISRNINVGGHSMIGAGSIVLKNVKEGSHIFGNPAQPIPFFEECYIK